MMRKDQAPALALLLLRVFGPRSYRDSLAGDLIEEYGRGRNRLWVWREVLCAIGAVMLKRPPLSGTLSAIKAAILTVGLIMLGAATFSWAASLTDEGQSSVSREP